MLGQITNIKQHKIIFVTFSTIIACLFLVLIISGIIGIVNKIEFGDEGAYRDTISIQGQGKIYAKPDIAYVNLSVITQGYSLKGTQDSNSKKMNGVIEFLKGFEIEEKDIKTINYNIYPQYSYEERKAPRIVGYEINQTIELKIRNLDKVSEILEKSVAAGVNQINSLRFWIDKDEELKAEARKIAIEDAKKKAQVLASDLGVELGDLIGYNDDNSYYPTPIYRAEMGGIGGGGETPDIQTGENEIIINVSLIYEID